MEARITISVAGPRLFLGAKILFKHVCKDNYIKYNTIFLHFDIFLTYSFYLKYHLLTLKNCLVSKTISAIYSNTF